MQCVWFLQIAFSDSQSKFFFAAYSRNSRVPTMDVRSARNQVDEASTHLACRNQPDTDGLCLGQPTVAGRNRPVASQSSNMEHHGLGCCVKECERNLLLVSPTCLLPSYPILTVPLRVTSSHLSLAPTGWYFFWCWGLLSSQDAFVSLSTVWSNQARRPAQNSPVLQTPPSNF